MADHTGLDERLRHALRDEAVPPAPVDDVKPAVLHRLRQRRAARARVAATSAVVLVVCVAGAVVLGTLGSSPPQSALSGSPSTTAPAANPGSVLQPSAHAPAGAASSPPVAGGFAPAAPAASCAQVQVGTNASVCAGSISPAPTSAGPAATAQGAAATLPGGPSVVHLVTLPLGQTLRVDLPGGTGVHWSVPRSSSPLLERVSSSSNGATGAAAARFVPHGVGMAEVVADGCPPGVRCRPGTTSYLLTVNITR